MTLGLPGRVEADNRDHIISQLRGRVSQLEEELSREKTLRYGVQSGLETLREILGPLHQGLKMIFGELDAAGIGSAPANGGSRSSAVWESWKQKLGGQTAQAIDVLALHGEMNAEQLRIHLSCAKTHVYNVISKLNTAGIIRKNGGKISLKEV